MNKNPFQLSSITQDNSKNTYTITLEYIPEFSVTYNVDDYIRTSYIRKIRELVNGFKDDRAFDGTYVFAEYDIINGFYYDVKIVY